METANLFHELFGTFRKMSRERHGCSFRICAENHFEVCIYDDFKAVSAFIKAMKSIGKNASIKSGKVIIRVRLALNSEPYVIIESRVCNSTQVYFFDEEMKVNGYQENGFSIPLMFFSSTKMYYQFGKRWIPANIKTFGYVPSIVRKTLMEHLSQGNLLWRDFMRYDKLPAVSLELVNHSHCIKDLLEQKFKTTLPNCVNKKPFDVMYAACCAIKYVPPEQHSVLFSANIGGTVLARTPKDTAETYINQVVIDRLKNADDSHIRGIVSDYVRMAFIGKEKVNLLLGKKGYKRLHDEYQVKHRLKQNKIKLKIPDTPLSKLVLPCDFKRIENNKDLVAESVRNNNCVWSYTDKINKGKCLIYTLDYNGEHCTIEIGFSRGKYCVRQLRKSCNQAVSEQTSAYIQDAVKQANK